jgi:hypothetical protein
MKILILCLILVGCQKVDIQTCRDVQHKIDSKGMCK